MNKKTTIKGFKAFDKGLICKGFQFEVGKEYTHKGDIKLCDKGFHFCLNPLDILNYYNLCDCEFAEIEANEVSNEKENDSKRVAKKIKIGTKLDLPAFIKASFNFLWENCNKKDISSGDYSKLASSGNHSHLASSGDYSKLASSGNHSHLASSGDDSQLASSGNHSHLASSGDDSKLASSGDYSKLANSGDYSKLASSGNHSHLASSGDDSHLASSGDYSKLASSGNHSHLASSGDDSQLASSGDYSKIDLQGEKSVGANIGIDGMIKAKKGCWITLAEYDKKNEIRYVKSVKVDGKKIKEDVFYKLENNKFVEVK